MTSPAAGWRTSRPAMITAAALSAVIAAVALVWLLWAAWGHATSPKVQVLGYEVTGRTVTVRFEVVKQADDEVSCLLRARDASGAEVAREQVTLPPGRGHEIVEHTLRATTRPVSGEVQDCRAV